MTFGCHASLSYYAYVPQGAFFRKLVVSIDEKDKIVAMAWADRVSFEEIKNRTGLKEAEVIKIMRQELKSGSFRRWRKRVSGRATKHRSLWKARQRGPDCSED